MKVLKNARLIDGTGAAPVDGATVVLRDNRIDAVTTRNQSDWPAEAEISDVSGMTVLPGLIDCHDHMANHRYSLEHRWRLDEPQSTRHLRTAAVLKQTLAAGYTVIRDAAGLDVGFKRAIDEGLIEGPRLVLSLSIMAAISTNTRSISNAWPSAVSFSCRPCSSTNTTANRRSRMSANVPRCCMSITSPASGGPWRSG